MFLCPQPAPKLPPSPNRGSVEAVQSLTRASKVMERASGGLSLAHYRVLAAVAAGDERASRVAARLALGKPTVSASVEALCARGLLVRSGVAGDQRAIQLSLTEPGRELLEIAAASDDFGSGGTCCTHRAARRGDRRARGAGLGHRPGRGGAEEVSSAEEMRSGAIPAGADKVTAAEGGWVRRLSRYVLVHKRNLLIAFGGAIVGSLAQVIVPLVERQIVDNVIVRHNSPLAPWLVALLGLGVVTFVGAYFRRYRGGRVALDVQYDLRNAMQEHLQALDFANLDRMPTGQLVARANSDSMLVQGLLSFLPIMSGNILMLVLSLAVMVYLSPLLAVVSVACRPEPARSSPTGCAGGSSLPPGTASSARATSPRSSTRT